MTRITHAVFIPAPAPQAAPLAVPTTAATAQSAQQRAATLEAMRANMFATIDSKNLNFFKDSKPQPAVTPEQVMGFEYNTEEKPSGCCVIL